jgi:hypothetical protein
VYQVTGILAFYHCGREAEGEESRMRLTKRRATERFNPELKIPRLMSAKNHQLLKLKRKKKIFFVMSGNSFPE